jgi:hypothetical protein
MNLEDKIKRKFGNEKPIYKLPENANIGLIYDRRKGEDRRGKNKRYEPPISLENIYKPYSKPPGNSPGPKPPYTIGLKQ